MSYNVWNISVRYVQEYVSRSYQSYSKKKNGEYSKYSIPCKKFYIDIIVAL